MWNKGIVDNLDGDLLKLSYVGILAAIFISLYWNYIWTTGVLFVILTICFKLIQNIKPSPNAFMPKDKAVLITGCDTGRLYTIHCKYISNRVYTCNKLCSISYIPPPKKKTQKIKINK